MTEKALLDRASSPADYFEAGAEAERARIVAWLRENARLWGPRAGTWMLNEAADAISRGDHIKGEGDG